MNQYYEIYANTFGENEKIVHYINWISQMHRTFRKKSGYPEYMSSHKKYINEFTVWLKQKHCKHHNAFRSPDNAFTFCPDCNKSFDEIP